MVVVAARWTSLRQAGAAGHEVRVAVVGVAVIVSPAASGRYARVNVLKTACPLTSRPCPALRHRRRRSPCRRACPHR